MQHSRGVLYAAAVLALAVGVAGPAKAGVITPAVEYTSTTTLNDTRPFTLGYSFTLSGPVTVNALGVWDDGFGNSHDVGIWNSSGILIASATVLGSDPLVGHFRWDTIANTILGAGQYTIGAQVYENGASYTFPGGATGLTTISQFTWISDEQLFGTGLNMPTGAYGSYGQNGILTADFSITSNESVPEPITMSLFGAGLACMAALRRRRKNTA